ncbi:MAG: GIY-YIG nuclease family protein [Methanomicrobiales archaeon]|nr:GIY-YIG nuclease family protein [Methanomicrobiales archaeon]
MKKGVYCLVLFNKPCTVRVGALGDLAFPGGWHVYTGSALGQGGLKRVQRHIKLAASRNITKRWHIDYLLGHEEVTLLSALCAHTTRPIECKLANAIGGVPVRGFGCSDCHCDSHLFYFESDPVNTIISAMGSIDLDPIIATINTKQGHC